MPELIKKQTPGYLAVQKYKNPAMLIC